MATEVSLTSDVFVPAAPSTAAGRMQSIRLNDPELTARLDALFAEHFANPRRPTLRVQVNHVLKRTLDVLVAGLGLMLMWPVIGIAALATLCDTGRPIFYSQIRRIRFGRRARIYKLRTMYHGADRNLDALVDIKNNGRFLNVAKAEASYTPAGRILERLWLVEVPQLWNVLCGEMSLVGNRPIPDYVIGVLGPTHEVAERFAGPQGMTGYTQIIGREHVTDEERIQLEYRYSQVFEKGDVFIEDLRIILITALTYARLTRRRTTADFLPAVDSSSAWLAGYEGCEVRRCGTPRGAHTSVSAAEHGHGHGLTVLLACPTCYEINHACDASLCKTECVQSCDAKAIDIVGSKAQINDRCVACSACVHACPREAIDKAPLKVTEAGLHCSQCGTTYPRKNGVYDLLPQRTNLEHSPYFDFYESEYVADNPDVHLEDTDWKVRELRPLLKRDVRYQRMLDLGCGAGVLGRRIAADLQIRETVSADWSTQILEVAHREAPEATYVRMDAAYLPFRNASFDLALLIDVIEHQHKPDQVLSELQRVADRLLIRTPLEDCWYESIRRQRKDLFRESSGHVVHYHPSRIRGQLGDNGWMVRNQSIRHIAWVHWKRVLTGPCSVSGKLTAAARYALRWVMPVGVYRRLFVTNYNAFCERAVPRGGPSHTDANGLRRSVPKAMAASQDHGSSVHEYSTGRPESRSRQG